jgi:hypothetical protein
MFKKFTENIIDTFIDKDIIVILFNRVTNHTELNNTEKVNNI